MPLKIEQLDHFRALETRDEAGLWQALETLADHLEDHLVLVWGTRVEKGNICRLTVFTARNAGCTPLYAGVTTSGTVVVGRADEGDAPPDMYALDDFDPLRDEIVSIAVTAKLRVVGERLDLWLVARRPSRKGEGESEALAYHAMVWVDAEGRPKLQPALDDRDAAADASWPASPAGGLPEQLRAWNFSCAPGVDPFDPIQKDPRLGLSVSVDAVAWAGHTLWFATPKSLQMTPFGSDEPHPYSEPLVERAIAIAPTNHPPWKARIIACGDNRMLFALTETEHGIKMPWYQERDEFPMSVAFLAVGEGRGAQGEWPDIIVGSSNSRLERLRYVGSAEIREVWNRCWRHLGLPEVQERIDAARDLARMALPRSQALLVGAIDGVVEGAPKVSPEQRQRWLKALSELFRQTQSKQVLSAGLSRLLRALRGFARSEMSIGPLPDYGGELLPALIYNVYNRHLEAASRDRVDDIVRTAKWSGPARMDPNVRRLIERSKRSREDMREDEKPTEPFEPRILIRHAYIELGRWASALLPADSHRFGTMESLAKLLSSATLRAGDGQRYLALAQTHQVDLRPLLSRGKIGTETYCPWKPPTGDEVLQLAPLADENADRLLVLTAPGRLVVLEPEVKENEQVLIIAKLELGTQHRASAMAIVPRRDGTFTVAIASHHDRRSELTLVDVHSNRLTRNDPLPLDLPRAEILDLSTDGKGGHWLMAGAKHGTRVLLRRLGDADAPCRMRILQSGTLALRFSAAEDPGYAVYGGLSGLLWCVDLEAEGSACDLAWTYQLQGAIRSIERLHIYGEAHFLVGTESGELCLLRARDGRRIWKGRVQAPVRHVVATEQPEPLVLVVMPRGLVASFTLITETDRVEAWDAFEGYLQTLQRLGVAHDDEAWNDPDGGGVKAFYELKRLNHSMIEVVASHQNRETRARLVRHLVQQPAAVEDEFPYIAGKLSFRDLTLLLSYLPDEFTAWDQTIRNELWRRDMSGERGDGSTGAAMAAMVTFIQRLGRQKPPILELIDSQPPEGYFHFPWARISFNRVLVQALDTECGDTRSMGPVIGILDHLLGLSPLLFTNAYCVFQYDSDEEKDCKALVAVLTGSRIAGSSFNKGLKRLAERLEAIAPPSNWLGVLHALAAIHDCALRCPDRQWAQWRRSILAALRRLAEIVFARGDWEPAVKPVVEGLAGFLHAGRFPVMRKRWRTGSDGSKAPGSTSRLNASRTPPRSLPRIRGASTLGICCTIRAGSYRRSSDGNASMCSGGFARAWNCCPRCARNARGGSSCDCR